MNMCSVKIYIKSVVNSYNKKETTIKLKLYEIVIRIYKYPDIYHEKKNNI